MIGLFDSGIGGLTVVRELLRSAPDAGFIYLGDTARTPYGNKSHDTIIEYALDDAAYLLNQGATSLVVACNTASAHALEALTKAYPNVLIADVIGPAVRKTLSVTQGRVGIIGTRATVGSGVYEKHLREERSELNITSIACPLFVPLVEEGWLDDAETKRIVKHYLAPLRQMQVDTLILGCTHYPLLAPIIQRYMGNQVTLIDSGVSVVGELLSASKDLAKGSQRYTVSDVSEHTTQIASRWLGKPVLFEKAVLGR
jgi:glutamate racemase